jgi:hypothetical protein
VGGGQFTRRSSGSEDPPDRSIKTRVCDGGAKEPCSYSSRAKRFCGETARTTLLPAHRLDKRREWRVRLCTQSDDVQRECASLTETPSAATIDLGMPTMISCREFLTAGSPATLVRDGCSLVTNEASQMCDTRCSLWLYAIYSWRHSLQLEGEAFMQRLPASARLCVTIDFCSVRHMLFQ